MPVQSAGVMADIWNNLIDKSVEFYKKENTWKGRC